MRLIDADAVVGKAYDSGLWNDAINGFHQRVVDVEDIDDSPTIKTKQIKYYDEDENVWKTGSVIVDEEREGEK